jgi:hypothetical protein
VTTIREPVGELDHPPHPAVALEVRLDDAQAQAPP